MVVAPRRAPAQRGELFEIPIRACQPVGDLDVVVRPAQRQDDITEVAADPPLVELEREVHLLEPRASDTEEVGTAADLGLGHVGSASSLIPREEVPDEDAFRDPYLPDPTFAATMAATARAMSSADIEDALKIAS